MEDWKKGRYCLQLVNFEIEESSNRAGSDLRKFTNFTNGEFVSFPSVPGLSYRDDSTQLDAKPHLPAVGA